MMGSTGGASVRSNTSRQSTGSEAVSSSGGRDGARSDTARQNNQHETADRDSASGLPLVRPGTLGEASIQDIPHGLSRFQQLSFGLADEPPPVIAGAARPAVSSLPSPLFGSMNSSEHQVRQTPNDSNGISGEISPNDTLLEVRTHYPSSPSSEEGEGDKVTQEK